MPLPYSFTIRDAKLEDAADIARVHIQAWQETYQGIMTQSYLDSISFEQRLKQRKDILSQHSAKEKHLVACNQEKKIIGFCDIGTARNKELLGTGEIYAIYILKQYQKKGVGSALWAQSIDYFKTHGLIPFNVLVLEPNWWARLFYEKKGGVIIHVKEITLGNKSYKEICYSFGIPPSPA